MFTRRSHHEGYLFVDHRASPGLPPEIARQCGYDPAFAGEGKVLETATLGCNHCGTHVVKNPFRTRERNYCAKCNGRYICDYCHAAACHPDYIHRSIDDIKDLVDTGRWALSGSMSNPILTPIMRLF